MPTCAPQRYIANDRNVAREATLAASSVLAVEDQVIGVPVARTGTAEVQLFGPYTGAEPATYDVEIVDTTPDDPIVSAPVFAGAGSSRLTDIAATGVAAQSIAVELVDPGAPARHASVAFEGVTLKARAIGADGNDIRIAIDQSGLSFDDTDFSLLVDLRAGQGGPSAGLEGAAFDWQTAVLGADDVIPASAKRVTFGEDRSTIYLAYKRYADNKWLYHFVPELKRDISKGTPVKFVTGGREVSISDGVNPAEVYSSVVTVYDLLAAIRASSMLLTVDGIVANDRSPTGQAARELLVRTDAHVLPSTGSGGSSALGFVDTFANSNARTELVVAKCYAVRGADHPLARLGSERWEVSSSLGGVIGEAVTGTPFVEVEGRFGFTIPTRLPTGFGTVRGRFDVVQINYQPRPDDVEPPPICPVSMRLGPEATDQQITLRWTKRPSGDCDCADMPKPVIGGRCLGTIAEGGDSDMTSYSEANRQRLIALYEWYADTVRINSRHIDIGAGANPAGGSSGLSVNQDPAFSDPVATLPSTIHPAVAQIGFNPEPLRDMVAKFEDVLAQINELTEGLSPVDLRDEGETAWDAAAAEFMADIDGPNESGGTPGWYMLAALTDRYNARLNQVLITAGISPLGKSDASILESGDGCWRDYGDAYYWTVEGSVKGGYAPAFVNHPYYSSRRADVEGKYFATREFGFQINVKEECVALLEEGDEIILTIGDAGFPSTYNVGDTLTLPVIAAQDLHLAGGRDDNALQTWSVTGDVDGPFAPWQFIPGDSGTAYSDGGLSWDIIAGGIPNAKGDRFTFAIEGGHYRWRKDGGAWSSSIGIPVGDETFADGLSIRFVPGAAPSFAAGDVHSFRALQPWAVSNVLTPGAARWRWADGESPGPSLDIDLGSEQAVEAIALALHTIPEGATITLEGGDTAADDWSEPVTWREGLIVQTLSEPRTARYLRLSLEDADGGGIGWVWLGVPLTTALSAEVKRRSTVRIKRGDAVTVQGGATLASARGCDVEWTEGAVSEPEAMALLDMFEWCKEHDDEALIVVPHVNRPGDAVIGRFERDELDFVETSRENRTVGDARRYTLQMPIAGYLR